MNRSKPLPAFQTTLLLSAALDREGSIRLSHGANVFAIDGPCPLGVLGPPRFAENLWDSRQTVAREPPARRCRILLRVFARIDRTANDTRDVGAMSVERALPETETHLTGEPRHRTLAWKLTGLLLVIFYIGKL